MIVYANYGGGTNSTAMLIECAKRGEQIDEILFADTGGEKPHTYEYLKTFSAWLETNGMPAIQVVKNEKAWAKGGLEQFCLDHKSLPSIAYGFKSCSLKYKSRPIEEYLKGKYPDREWQNLMGIDAGETHRARYGEDDKKNTRYPLIEWDLDRDACVEIIKAEGLCLPGKSACFFCPSMRANDVKQLAVTYPDLMERALEMESKADLDPSGHIKGLGVRWRWKDVIATDDMFADEYMLTPEMTCG